VDVKIRTTLTALTMLTVCVAAYPQPTPQPTLRPTQPSQSNPPTVTPTDVIPAVPVAPSAPSNTIPPPAVPAAPLEQTVDQMLDRLEHLRAQKAEIERKEQELLSAIRKKIEKQSERLDRLGITPRPPEPVAPLPTIGRQ
jgi:hypothetical protein